MNDTTIETPRLLLKAIYPDKIKWLFETKSENEIVEFMGFGENGLYHLRDMYQKGMETHRLSLYYFLMVEKETAKPIGDCGFHSWNRLHCRAEIFYGMRDDSVKRKGFTKEALRFVLDFGFKELNLNRVEAFVADYNEPSVRLLKHYGFTKEGTARGHYLVEGVFEDSDFYSLLKPEWEFNGNRIA